ncbi:conserved hypothetical protein, partial [Ricinus communis]
PSDPKNSINNAPKKARDPKKASRAFPHLGHHQQPLTSLPSHLLHLLPRPPTKPRRQRPSRRIQPFPFARHLQVRVTLQRGRHQITAHRQLRILHPFQQLLHAGEARAQGVKAHQVTSHFLQ